MERRKSMPQLKANFTDVETFEAMPAGVYEVEVAEVEVRPSENSEYDYINWTLSVTEGDYINRKLWLVTSMSPKAAWKLKEALLAFGADESDLEGELEFDPDDFIGARCKASTTQESYEGTLRNRVQAVHPLTEDVKSPESPSGAKKVARPKIR